MEPKNPLINPVCKECGLPIMSGQKYLMHKDGTILCKPCFEKLQKEGKVK